MNFWKNVSYNLYTSLFAMNGKKLTHVMKTDPFVNLQIKFKIIPKIL